MSGLKEEQVENSKARKDKIPIGAQTHSTFWIWENQLTWRYKLNFFLYAFLILIIDYLEKAQDKVREEHQAQDMRVQLPGGQGLQGEGAVV